jgi:hypothetical protein
MYDEEREQEEPKELGDHLFAWKRKFDNIWYHYKIAIIMGIFLFAFIIFVIAQCSGRIQGDADIAYIGAQQIDLEHFEDLQRALNEILGEDLNGDGNIHVEFTHFFYMTQNQIENARADNRPVDMQAMRTVQTQINLMLARGNIILYFIDPGVYRELAAGNPGVFMPLEDLLGYLPDDAHDAYGLRLGSLQAWDYYAGINNFPPGTVLAVRQMRLEEEGRRDVQELYERNIKMFRRLADFKYK